MTTPHDKDLPPCVLAALILHDANLPITGDKIKTILDASKNTDVQLVYCNIVAKFLADKNVTQLVTQVQTSGMQIPGVGEGDWEIISELGVGNGSEVDMCDRPGESSDGEGMFGLFD
jgi:ribosomal protein L12E/L44/L45/RPP1/RPP2